MCMRCPLLITPPGALADALPRTHLPPRAQVVSRRVLPASPAAAVTTPASPLRLKTYTMGVLTWSSHKQHSNLRALPRLSNALKHVDLAAAKRQCLPDGTDAGRCAAAAASAQVRAAAATGCFNPLWQPSWGPHHSQQP